MILRWILTQTQSHPHNHTHTITHTHNHQSPITNHQSPITNHQSPITNQQSPITNHQSTIHLAKASKIVPGVNFSRGFALAFLSRHPELKFSKPREISPEIQEHCNEREMQCFFSNLGGLIDKHKYIDALIFNFDETMVQFLSRCVKVFAPHDINRPTRISPSDPLHITIGLFISADGEKNEAIIDLLCIERVSN